MTEPFKHMLSKPELIKRLKQMRGPYLGDGVNPSINVPSLLKYLDKKWYQFWK